MMTGSAREWISRAGGVVRRQGRQGAAAMLFALVLNAAGLGADQPRAGGYIGGYHDGYDGGWHAGWYRDHGDYPRPIRGPYIRRTGPFFAPYVGVPYRGYGFSLGSYYRYEYVPPSWPYPRSRIYYGHGAGRHGYSRSGAPEPWTDDWYAYCASKYRSFNPRTGRYLAYSGRYRLCR